MTILITGDRGLVGSSLKQVATLFGFRTVGLDILSDYPTVEVLSDFMKSNDVRKIMHLGARPFIPDCYGRSIQNVVNSNIVFTANMLSAALENNVDKILYFSTSEVYGNSEEIPINERTKTYPISTYAASKLAAENLCRTFCTEAGMNVVILRHFNIYGPRDSHPRIIPKLMSSFKYRTPARIGNRNFTRDFTYVDDAAISALNVLNADTKNGEIFCHGTGIESNLDDIVSTLEELYGTKIDIEYDESNERPADVRRLVCDRKKYDEMFPEHIPLGLKEGLKITKLWYDNNMWPWERKNV